MGTKKQQKKPGLDLSRDFRPPFWGMFGCDPEDSTYKGSQVVVLPVPYEQTTSYKGNTKEGPKAIIDASRFVETYDEELDYEVIKVGIHTLPEFEPDCTGPEATGKRLEKIAAKIAADGKFLVSLGGEHSITPPLVAGILKTHKKLTVLQIDAHADLRDEYEGTPNSHACAMRRCRDLGVSTFGFGIRSYSKEEADYVKKTGRAFYTAKELKENPALAEQFIDTIEGPVYVSIDIDGFDPAYVPATGTPEPGGLDWYEVRNILQMVARRKDVVAFDVVELAPIGGLVAPDFLCAKLIYKFLGFVFYPNV